MKDTSTDVAQLLSVLDSRVNAEFVAPDSLVGSPLIAGFTLKAFHRMMNSWIDGKKGKIPWYGMPLETYCHWALPSGASISDVGVNSKEFRMVRIWHQLMTWSLSRSYIDLSFDVLKQLGNTDLPSNGIPASFFKQLPHWGIYIPAKFFITPDVGDDYTVLIDGFIAGYQRFEQRDYLTITIWVLEQSEAHEASRRDKSSFVPFFIELTDVVTPESIVDSFSRGLGMQASEDSHLIAMMVNVLLFTLSELAKTPAKTPPKVKQPPRAKSVAKSWVITAPDTSAGRGIKIGREFEAQVATFTEQSRGARAAHIRRGHWHGYWKGSRPKAGEVDKRDLVFHWLPPIVVGSSSEV